MDKLYDQDIKTNSKDFKTLDSLKIPDNLF